MREGSDRHVEKEKDRISSDEAVEDESHQSEKYDIDEDAVTDFDFEFEETDEDDDDVRSIPVDIDRR